MSNLHQKLTLDHKKLEQLPNASQIFEYQAIRSNYENYKYEEIDLDSENVLTKYKLSMIQELGKFFAINNELKPTGLFIKAAALARDKKGFERMNFLSYEEKEILRIEINKPWKLPFRFYGSLSLAALCAITQGTNETLINGALLFYPDTLGLDFTSTKDRWIHGLIVSSPYLFCFLISTLITAPLNDRYGRKKVILVGLISIIGCCIWQSLVNTWYNLFIARAMLGAFGIGPISSTVPVYLTEISPSNTRGAYTLLWQFFCAFGMLWGFLMSMAFYYVSFKGDSDYGDGKNWRLMLGFGLVPALFALIPGIFFSEETPRWLVEKKRYLDAFQTVKRLRAGEICAARDLFYKYILIEEEPYRSSFFLRLKDLFIIRRNRNAIIASFILTFLQQFSGINNIIHYSTLIFRSASISNFDIVQANVIYGIIGFVFALPPIFLVDKYGRRPLLLITFPLMGICMLLTGFSFWISENKTHLVVMYLAIYLFAVFYSFGSGVITFPYTAECFPLHLRSLGTSLMIGNLWFWNFWMTLLWPIMANRFTIQGGFAWFAGWNFIGFWLVLWFVPETKEKTLEELDMVFDIDIMKHFKFQNKALWNKCHIFKRRRKRNNNDENIYNNLEKHISKNIMMNEQTSNAIIKSTEIDWEGKTFKSTNIF